MTSGITEKSYKALLVKVILSIFVQRLHTDFTAAGMLGYLYRYCSLHWDTSRIYGKNGINGKSNNT